MDENTPQEASTPTENNGECIGNLIEHTTQYIEGVGSVEGKLYAEGKNVNPDNKTSVFDFTMNLVTVYSDIEGCCTLIGLHLHDEQLPKMIEITKAQLREKRDLIEKILTMDVDTTLALDKRQIGEDV